MRFLSSFGLLLASAALGACANAPKASAVLQEIYQEELDASQRPVDLFVSASERSGTPGLIYGSVISGESDFQFGENNRDVQSSDSGKVTVTYRASSSAKDLELPDFSSDLDFSIRSVFGQDAKRLDLTLVVAPQNASIDHLYFDELNEHSLSPEFVIAENLFGAAWQMTTIGLVSHEIHHAYIKSAAFSASSKVSSMLPETEIVYTEAAAHIFSHCVTLNATGRVSPFGEKIFHGDVVYDIASDKMLAAIDDGRLKGETRAEQFSLGRVVADAVWDRKVGTLEEISLGTVKAKRLNDLCTMEAIGSISAMRALVLGMIESEDISE